MSYCLQKLIYHPPAYNIIVSTNQPFNVRILHGTYKSDEAYRTPIKKWTVINHSLVIGSSNDQNAQRLSLLILLDRKSWLKLK